MYHHWQRRLLRHAVAAPRLLARAAGGGALARQLALERVESRRAQPQLRALPRHGRPRPRVLPGRRAGCAARRAACRCAVDLGGLGGFHGGRQRLLHIYSTVIASACVAAVTGGLQGRGGAGLRVWVRVRVQ
eukprot:scaffold48965_cov75-Phaeocystis_antarctica.AAC.1